MPMVALTNANVVCSTVTLSQILGVSDRRVRQLVGDKVLKCARTKQHGMHFKLGESVQAFVKYECDLVREQCASCNGDEYNAAKTRRMVALARREELTTQAAEGKYLVADDVGFFLTSMITACKQRLLAIASRTMHQLVGRTSAMECNQIVDTEVRGALTELSEAKWKKSVEFRKSQTAYLRSQGFPEEVVQEMVNRNGDEPEQPAD
jgi:hypothetical protein